MVLSAAALSTVTWLKRLQAFRSLRKFQPSQPRVIWQRVAQAAEEVKLLENQRNMHQLQMLGPRMGLNKGHFTI